MIATAILQGSRAALFAATAIALAGGMSAALAQDAPAPGAGGLETVVVTAEKRSESAQTVPLTVTALSGDVIAQQSIKDLFQAVTLVPGVIFSRAPDDGLALTFRGLGNAARSQAFEQSVALFTDGAFIGKGRLYTSSFFDVDRMEFIKGTQSTLLGKNASLGAISVVTRQPGDTLSFEGRAGYEFIDNGYSLDAAGDVPLDSSASLRVAAHYNDLGGWVRNDFTDHNGPEHKDLGLRLTVRDNVTDALTVTGSYQFSQNQQIGASYQLVGALAPSYGEGNLDGHTAQFTTMTPNGDTLHQTESHIADLKLELAIGDQTLVWQSAFIHYNLSFIDDLDFSTDDAVNFLRHESYSQYTQELRLQSPADYTLSYMAGLFYMSSDWDSLERQLWAVPAFPPPPSPISGQLFNGPFANRFIQNSATYSGFASGTWRISDALRLAAGMRYTRESKGVLFGRTPAAPITIWNSIANPPFDPTPLKHDSSFLDGNVSLEYDVAEDMMAYASFGHGSKSGGYAETNTIAVDPALLVNGKVPPALVAAGSAIKDESTKSAEIGLKSTLFNNRLRFNLAGFWTDVENFQDTVFTGGTLGFITFNGPVRSRGVEIDSALQVTPGFRLDGGLTYADATGTIQPIDPATSAPEVDASGNPVYTGFRRSQAPLWIVNFGAYYDARLDENLDLRLGATVRHRSSMYNQRQDMFRSPLLTTLDLSVGIHSLESQWGADLVAKNVSNAISQDFASPSVDPRFPAYYGAYLAGPTPLRTIMLTVSVER